MKFRIIIVIAILLIATGVIISQNNAKKDSVLQENQVKTEMKQQSPTPTPIGSETGSPSAQTSGSPTVMPSQSPAPALEQTFEIRGAVTSISGSNFVISGKTIVIDRSKVVNFQQTTILEVGKTIQVEGVTINGVMYAREIKLPSQESSGSSSGQN